MFPQPSQCLYGSPSDMSERTRPSFGAPHRVRATYLAVALLQKVTEVDEA